MSSQNIGILTNEPRYSMFKVGNVCIKFKTSPYLECYLSIQKWNKGYIECMTKYSTIPQPVEEFIDLRFVAERLKLPQNFFDSIKKVTVQ